MIFLLFILAFVLNFFTTPILIKYAIKYGWSVEPRSDRWHKTTTALFGGLTIFASSIVCLLFSRYYFKINYDFAFLFSLFLFFILGFVDDIYELNSKSKFFLQILIAIFFVITTNFLIPIFDYKFLNYFVSIFWILLITNSANLLDNMDGLLSGIIIITSLFLGFSFIFLSNKPLAIISFIIAGSTLSFLYYNYKPAKIFMGDCGSLTLGFSISALSLNLLNQNIIKYDFNYLLLPFFITAPFLLDVILVIVRRTISGRKIYIGGKDHISHRLVFWGFDEVKAVQLIYFLTFSWNLLSLLMLININTSILYFLIFFLFFLTIFLGYILSDLKVYSSEDENLAYKNIRGISTNFKKGSLFFKILVNKKFIIVNFFDTISFIFVFLIITNTFNIHFLKSDLLLYITIKVISSNLFKFYKISWKFTTTIDIFKITFFNIIIYIIFYILTFQRQLQIEILLIDMILSFNFLLFTRISYKLINESFSRLRQNRKHVIIYGAGKSGVLISKELMNNLKYNMFPLYFIDDDILKNNSYLNSIKILNPITTNINDIFIKNNIKTLIISSYKIDQTKIDNLRNLVDDINLKVLKLDFNLTEIFKINE